MKLKPFSLQRKLFIITFGTILIFIIFAYLISNSMYEKLYVNYVRDNLKIQVSQVAGDYKGGELTDEFKEKVAWLNDKMTGGLVIVSKPEELNACLPHEVDYQSLISGSENEKLMSGQYVYRQGYEKTFRRELLAVIYPLLDKGELKGIIYSYVPLSSMSVITKSNSFVWIISMFLLAIVMFIALHRIINRIFKPLKEMEDAAIRVSLGDYSKVLPEGGDDEVGRLAKAFNLMSKAMKEEEERLKAFLSDVSHELRTPLSYVKGYTSAILEGIIRDRDEQIKYLRLIDRETSNIQVQLQDLLDLINMDSEMFVLKPVPVAFAQFIEDVMEAFESILSNKNITLHMDLDPDVIISGEERRLEQIIKNIVENAVRYTNAGGSLTIKLTKKDSTCTLLIEDTGMGISEEHLPKITERYYRVNKARTRFDGGSGLGLNIVSKLINLHHGTIRIESEVDVGTKVFLTFPLMEDNF